jgi:hypothetical protein
METGEVHKSEANDHDAEKPCDSINGKGPVPLSSELGGKRLGVFRSVKYPTDGDRFDASDNNISFNRSERCGYRVPRSAVSHQSSLAA